MRLVKALSTHASVVEDDDGFRILITNAAEIEHHVQREAEELDVVMHIIEQPEADFNRAGFIGQSTVPCVGHPTYLSLVAFLDPPKPKPTDFVHLHTHSDFSSLDGLSTIQEIVDAAVADNQPAIAVTDHGTCASHPHLQAVADKAGIKPIFGLEAYFVDDRHRRPIPREKGMTPEEIEAVVKDQTEVKDYWHLILWAMDDEGLRNLWAMSTEANREGTYYKPRMDWDTLEKFNKGVMASTACLRGPVADAIKKDNPQLAFERMARLQGIFGDRLYAELHINTVPEQKKVNEGTVAIAEKLGVPTIVVADSHYSCPDHKLAHKVWVAIQTNSSLSDDTGLFDGDVDYHITTRQEAIDALSYLDHDVVVRSIDETVRVANRCTARLSGDPTPPKFHDTIAEDVTMLRKMCFDSWETKVKGKKKPEIEYLERFEREIGLLIDKDLCGYFDIVADYCLWAKRNGILVGPGRGSGGASLVAYLCGITEIDPVDAELPFERFLTRGRTELPDFDVDFPSDRLEDVMNYAVERWGASHVVRVGTHIKLKSKGIVRNLAVVMKEVVPTDFADIDAITKIITRAEAGTAGLGLTWEELWDQNGEDLAPYRKKYPALFDMADLLVGRLKSYGKHAGGIVISTDKPLTDSLPLRLAGDQLVAEFDKDALAELGLVKFDFLGIRTLDTLQGCVDLIQAKTGERIDLYSWKDEYDDQEVWAFLTEGQTLGCFQIETPAGTRTTKEVRPASLHDLADVITLDRPGPMRSGLDRLYLDRRFGRQAVSYADPRLETVLHRTFGVMLYQEDIMGICQQLAGYDEEQADYVRKILGKKKVAAAQEEGRKFIPACVERGMTQEAVEVIWNQMEEFSRYSFNKAHAYGYAVLAYWCAWLSYHYPVEFYTSAMSTVDADRIADFVTGANNRDCSVLPPDINLSGKGFSAQGTVIRFGLDAIKGVGEKAIPKIVEHQPYTSFEQFMELKPANMGIAKLLVRAGCFDSLDPNRKKLEAQLAQYENGDVDRCVNWNPNQEGAPNGLPCTFDWSSEPPRIGKSGKVIKQIPIPKKCTVRCRNYVKRSSLAEVNVEPYTPKEIREIETELFGIFLSSSPFDVLTGEDRKELLNARQLEEMREGRQTGFAAIVRGVTHKIDRNGKKYAFLDLFLGDGSLRAVCFSSNWVAFKDNLKVGNMVAGGIEKTDRGYTLVAPAPVLLLEK